jgi:hypothetical protein
MGSVSEYVENFSALVDQLDA